MSLQRKSLLTNKLRSRLQDILTEDSWLGKIMTAQAHSINKRNSFNSTTKSNSAIMLFSRSFRSIVCVGR
ncbi:CLUMA_CG011244, isoform A [Clunio marinus]|uniref:CLUMA_CG011244, isoform A n=1 Tax=Clunio marinus TaxID=568069 RepID=A0A1J1IC60_9DIPT|nr:CLUMA_CG011244, isoform A [Clunio marinus]